MALREPELKPHSWSQKFWSLIVHNLLGWRIYGEIPADPKYVAVVAPHTSNWDFFILFMASRAVDLPFPNFVAKHTVFRGPVGALLRAVGGIPINRSKNFNFVDQLVDAYNSRERMILGITPEGTRSKTDYWRSGFYYIALGADVPIAFVYLDYGTKSVGIAPGFHPTGDVDADMAVISDFYADCVGRHPELQGEIRIRPREEQSSPNDGAIPPMALTPVDSLPPMADRSAASVHAKVTEQSASVANSEQEAVPEIGQR